jgi:hypothetical protein
VSGWTIAVLVGIVWPAVTVVVAWQLGRRLRDVRRSETRPADPDGIAMAPAWACPGCAECAP